jgi:hypothetical protein
MKRIGGLVAALLPLAGCADQLSELRAPNGTVEKPGPNTFAGGEKRDDKGVVCKWYYASGAERVAAGLDATLCDDKVVLGQSKSENSEQVALMLEMMRLQQQERSQLLGMFVPLLLGRVPALPTLPGSRPPRPAPGDPVKPVDPADEVPDLPGGRQSAIPGPPVPAPQFYELPSALLDREPAPPFAPRSYEIIYRQLPPVWPPPMPAMLVSTELPMEEVGGAAR